MFCQRCGVPLEEGSEQCSVCGEHVVKSRIVRTKQENTETSLPSDPHNEDPLGFLFSNDTLVKPAVIWMAICLLLALGFIGVAFVQYSVEAMYAAFVCGGLSLLPILLVILGRTIQVAITIRRALTLSFIAAVILAGIYLLAQGIRESNVKIDATGAIDLARNENFTKTLVTFIICVAVLAGLVPLIRLLMRGTDQIGKVSHYKAESHRTIAQQGSENETTIKLRQLENERDIALRKLEIEQQKVQIEARRQQLLDSRNSQALLTSDTQNPPHTAPPASETGSPPPPPPPPPYGGQYG